MRSKFLCLSLLALGSFGHTSNSSSFSNKGYRSVAYYVNWAIYERSFMPEYLPANKLTHILYALSSIDHVTGEVHLTDNFADTKKHFPGDSWNEAGNNLYGCLKQLYLLKKQNRALKVLLSIGGWTYSSNFAGPAASSQGREAFASSAVALIADMGFDGLDIDWEYPANNTEAENMVHLLQAVKAALDAYGYSLDTPYHFKLTVTSSAGLNNYEKLRLADMAPYVDFWNLLAFDYAGNWSSTSANQANLFNSESNSASTPFNTESAVSYYISQGIPSREIVLGMPLFGRSFAATDGLGKPFKGVGTGTWEDGAYDYKVLPLDGAVERYDKSTGSSYSYDSMKRELISYDTPAVARQKAAWIQQMELGGAMWWESSADGVGSQSLIQNVVKVLGGVNRSRLDCSLNNLEYPNSTFDNLRAGIELDGKVATSPFSTLSTPVLCTSKSCNLPVSDSSLYVSRSAALQVNGNLTSTFGATHTITVLYVTASSSSIFRNPIASGISSSTSTNISTSSDRPPLEEPTYSESSIAGSITLSVSLVTETTDSGSSGTDVVPEVATVTVGGGMVIVTASAVTVPGCITALMMTDEKGSTVSTMIGESSMKSFISDHPKETQLAGLSICPEEILLDLLADVIPGFMFDWREV